MVVVLNAIPTFSFLDFRFDGGDKVVLLADFIYESATGAIIKCPKGFATDGASIPRFLWSIYGHPFYKKNIRAAVIHDYLYSLGEKKEADRIFEEVLRIEGRGATARQMYYGVKLFGSPNGNL